MSDLSSLSIKITPDVERGVKQLHIGDHLVHECDIDCDDSERLLAESLRAQLIRHEEEVQMGRFKKAQRWLIGSVAFNLALTLIDIAFVAWHLDLLFFSGGHDGH